MTVIQNQNIAYISGENGIYDNYVMNPSTRYGRNAANNNFVYTKNLNPPMPEGPKDNSLESIEEYNKKLDQYSKMLPPLAFEYRYMPNYLPGTVDKMALMGSAYEEMGSLGIPVQKINEPFVQMASSDTSKDGTLKKLADEMDASVLDLNNDGLIDLAEYSTTILASDMMSKSDIMNTSNITGQINNTGLDSQFYLMNKKNAAYTRMCLTDLMYLYNLPAARDAFIMEQGNNLNFYS